MIIMLQPDAEPRDDVLKAVLDLASRYSGITARPYHFTGLKHSFTEVHLIGQTAGVPSDVFEALPGVLRVVRVSARYRLIGRHDPRTETAGFTYNGVRIDDRTMHV